MKSFVVIALLACFLGVLITTVASDEKTENQEDETKLPAPEEAVEKLKMLTMKAMILKGNTFIFRPLLDRSTLTLSKVYLHW